MCTVIALYSISISKEKVDHVISVVLNKLAKKDIEECQSGDAKVMLINIRSLRY